MFGALGNGCEELLDAAVVFAGGGDDTTALWEENIPPRNIPIASRAPRSACKISLKKAIIKVYSNRGGISLVVKQQFSKL